MSRRSRKNKAEKVGGLAYYLSLLSLLLLSFSNSSALLHSATSLGSHSLMNLIILLAMLSLGFLLTRRLAPERLITFLHETKHAVLSGLAGNRWKNMKVDHSSGHFEYAYTKQTAHLNALIALAPYFLPLLTIPTSLLAISFQGNAHQPMVAMIGFAFGSDLYMNLRDISPHQSDFSSLRGGFGLGSLYAIAANTFLSTVIIAWALLGTPGLQMLANQFWHLVEVTVALIHR